MATDSPENAVPDDHREALSGGGGVAVGLVLGAVTYVGSLMMLGVNDRDRLVVGTLAAQYRGAITAAVADHRSRRSREG